jgi:CheY-like chemotaxis protein
MSIPRPFRILMLLPADATRNSCVATLRSRGYSVDVAHNASSFVTDHIDAAIIDTEYPDVNGFEIARRIRDEDKRRRVRLIASTTVATSAQVTRARTAGFDLVVANPITVEQVIVAMETLRSHAPP